MSVTISILRHSKQAKLKQLFSSRLIVALFALIIQLLTFAIIIRTSLFIVGIFNLPAIVALIACTFHYKIFNCQTQRAVKILLKIGVAKTVGGILLAVYMGLKYACILNNPETNSKMIIKYWAIYLGGSAIVDILYTLLAFLLIKKTRHIIKILRRESGSTLGIKLSSEVSSSCSTSYSEEDVFDKESQRSI